MKPEATVSNNTEVAALNIFEAVTFYLNFDEDFVEFEFQSKNHKWKELNVLAKSVIFEKVDTKTKTYQKSFLKLPIVSDESSTDSNYTKSTIRGSFRDVLLNLFSTDKKEFKLTIQYKIEFAEYLSTFRVAVPNIEQK